MVISASFQNNIKIKSYLEITYFTLHTGCITKNLCKIYKENKSLKFLPTIGLSVHNILQYISFSTKEKEAYQGISLSTSNYISIVYFFKNKVI